MARNTNRIHDWRKLKWPFCVTFLYYALLCLYTGSAEASEAGFLAVLIIALLIDAVAYACYLFFLSKAEENMGKLWFAFILAYVLASSDKLAIVWQMLAAVNTGSGTLRGNLWYSVGRYVYVPLAVILCCVALFMHVAF